MNWPGLVLLLFALSAILGAQLHLAFRFLPAIRIILLAEALFWFLGFVLRPLYLAIETPTDTVLLADGRLLQNGYRQIPDLLVLCLAAQLIFLGTIWMLSRIPALRVDAILGHNLSTHERQTQTSLSLNIATLFLLIGWTGRIASLAGLASLSAFNPFATCGSIALIVFGWNRSGAGGWRSLYTRSYIALSGEVIWSLIYASKAALIAPVLAAAIGAAMAGRKIRPRAIMIAVLAILIGFFIIQPLKGITTFDKVDARDSAPISLSSGFSVSILERFDLFSSVSDAYFYPADDWLTPLQAAELWVSIASPPGLTSRPNQSVGQLWNQQVRGATTASELSDVSLATGALSEGYVTGGAPMVIAQVWGMSCLTVLTGYILHRRRPASSVATCYIAGTTVLYEQGLLGFAATANKWFQLWVAAYVLTVLFGRATRARSKSMTASPLGPFTDA